MLRGDKKLSSGSGIWIWMRDLDMDQGSGIWVGDQGSGSGLKSESGLRPLSKWKWVLNWELGWGW